MTTVKRSHPLRARHHELQSLHRNTLDLGSVAPFTTIVGLPVAIDASHGPASGTSSSTDARWHHAGVGGAGRGASESADRQVGRPAGLFPEQLQGLVRAAVKRGRHDTDDREYSLRSPSSVHTSPVCRPTARASSARADQSHSDDRSAAGRSR